MNPKIMLKIFQYFYYFLAVFSGFFVAVCYDYGFNQEAVIFLIMSFCSVVVAQVFKQFHSKIP